MNQKINLMEKEKILRGDFALQTSLILCMLLSFDMETNNNAFPICFFSFAITQILSGLIGWSIYHDKRKKRYLKFFFWNNIVGTGIIVILGSLNNHLVSEFTGGLFVFCWIFCPFFMAIWAYRNSYLGWKEALESNNVDEEFRRQKEWKKELFAT